MPFPCISAVGAYLAARAINEDEAEKNDFKTRLLKAAAAGVVGGAIAVATGDAPGAVLSATMSIQYVLGKEPQTPDFFH